MRLVKGLSLSVILICLLLSDSASAQFRNWDRFEFGGNFIMASGTFNGVSGVYDGNNYFIGDTTVKRSISTSMGYGGFIGTSIPFKRLGHESVWAVSIEIMGNQLIWSDLNSIYNGSGTLAPNKVAGSLNGVTTQIAMPIGVDYKVGTDAIKTQRESLGASFGVGFMPVMNGTVMENVKTYDEHGSGFNYGLNPYGKAEVAFYAGMCFKLRAMFSYGKLNYMFENSNIGKFNDGPMRITGGTNLTLSLVIMPFSGRWVEHSWYNTYDTYNPFDKLH